MKAKKRPSGREKYKYVIFRIHSTGRIPYNDMKNAITNALMNWMGEKDFSDARVWLIKNLWKPGEQRGYIRCSPEHVDSVKMSLSLMHQIGDEKVAFQSLRVTGTIRSGKEKTKAS